MFTREQQKQRIAEYLAKWGDAALTTREIGQGVGLKVSPYLRNMLADLCHEGILMSWTVELPKWGTTRLFTYSTPENGGSR